MYKVIYRFADLQDKNHIYNVGDAYPREGSEPSEKRIDELAGKNNKIGKPLIEKVIVKKAIVEDIKEEPIDEEEPKPKKRKKADTE